MMAARRLAVIALAAGCGALFAAKSEPVVELDGETLEAALAAAPVAVVSFGAPWCAHCRRFEPQFLEAAGAVRDAGLDVLFGSLDAAEDRAVADAYGSPCALAAQKLLQVNHAVRVGVEVLEELEALLAEAPEALEELLLEPRHISLYRSTRAAAIMKEHGCEPDSTNMYCGTGTVSACCASHVK